MGTPSEYRHIESGEMRRAVIGLIIFFALISFLGIGKASEENYCTDKESWQEWDELIAKNPNNQDIHILHALRIGLCAKVERGDLTIEEATEIFENARDVLINKIKTESSKEKEDI